MIREEPRAAAADAARRVIRSLVASDIPDDQAESVAAALDRVARTLAPFDRPSRYDDPTGMLPVERSGGGPVVGDDDELFRTHPLVGRWHPLAPPLRMVAMGERPIAEVTYGPSYEGFSGVVHGGFVALAFDYITVLAAFLAGTSGVTGSLHVKYRRPVPLEAPMRYEAWVEKTSGRVAIAKAELHGPDGLCAQAETMVVGVRPV